jgi:hypothetical protein
VATGTRGVGTKTLGRIRIYVYTCTICLINYLHNQSFQEQEEQEEQGEQGEQGVLEEILKDCKMNEFKRSFSQHKALQELSHEEYVAAVILWILEQKTCHFV